MARRKPHEKKNFLSKIILLLPFFFILVLYLRFITRDSYGGDVGDLVTAAYSFGVAHPSGYPTFTLLGWLLTKLPLMLPPVTKVGFISAFSGAAAIFVFFLLAKKITRRMGYSLLGGLTLAFTYLFWLYAEIPELFVPNALIALVLLYLSYQFYLTRNTLFLYILAFMVGLSLTHHHTIVLIYPSILILISKHIKFLLNPKRIFACIVLFAAGLLPYVYVPFAASRKPDLNWDDATNIQNLLRLFFRVDYGTFSSGNFQKASGFSETLILNKVYFQDLIRSVSPPVAAICFLGAIEIWRINKRLFLSFLTAFILTGPVFINYAAFPLSNIFIHGISERFYVLSSVIIILFFPFGLTLIERALKVVLSKKILIAAVMGVFWTIPLLLLISNFNKTNLSGIKIGDNLGYDILKFVPKNSVVFTEGDTIVTNTWYVHYVLGYRPDVEVLQKGAYANNYFLDDASVRYKIEHKLNDLPGVEEVLKDLSRNREIFFVSPSGLANVTWIPYGLLRRYVLGNKIPEKNEYITEQKALWERIDPPTRAKLTIQERNLITSFIPFYYASSLVATGEFIFNQYDDVKNAFYFYNQAIDVDPNYSKTYAVMAAAQMDKLKECGAAEKSIDQAIKMAPERLYYILKYLNYKNCFKDKEKMKAYQKFYYDKFKFDVEKDVLRKK